MQKKILVVDDDADLLALLSESFRDAGYSVATASTGIDALKQARALTPDAIVLDLVLPEMDGFTVCETLRKDRATAAIPILMLTGLTSQLNRLAGLESGAVGYLTKPILPSELIAKVEEILRETKT